MSSGGGPLWTFALLATARRRHAGATDPRKGEVKGHNNLRHERRRCPFSISAETTIVLREDW
jgi:hypothetical protein